MARLSASFTGYVHRASDRTTAVDGWFSLMMGVPLR